MNNIDKTLPIKAVPLEDIKGYLESLEGDQQLDRRNLYIFIYSLVKKIEELEIEQL